MKRARQINLFPPFPDTDGLPAWEQSIYRFLSEWHSAAGFVCVQTSGSTGAPKNLQVSKEMMHVSARKTLQYFDLKPNDKMLLCLPADYIAGKMMLVRAVVGGLQLWAVEPDGLPFKVPLVGDVGGFDFASIVPLQAFEMLKNNISFINVRNILIGGGAISPALEKNLQDCPSRIFESYGMTETVSHIALRRVNGEERGVGFTPLPGISVRTDGRDCLVIDCPDLLAQPLATNDRAEIFPDGSFRILGRADNVINSGGIKIQPEEVERKIAGFFSRPFAVSAITDEKLGEKLVLAAEESISPEKLCEINGCLLPYEKLHETFILKLPLTATQKVNRKIIRMML
ncbi:MAG: AMP-binding protein [Prevotellaceae bacterium]|jgi:O-succinylbenzoic acid--CoA ligase|nr:AMP-binding protein [Prevotellaceae bacterium]